MSSAADFPIGCAVQATGLYPGVEPIFGTVVGHGGGKGTRVVVLWQHYAAGPTRVPVSRLAIVARPGH